jgi:hypothetical protein
VASIQGRPADGDAEADTWAVGLVGLVRPGELVGPVATGEPVGATLPQEATIETMAAATATRRSCTLFKVSPIAGEDRWMRMDPGPPMRIALPLDARIVRQIRAVLLANAVPRARR